MKFQIHVLLEGEILQNTLKLISAMKLSALEKQLKSFRMIAAVGGGIGSALELLVLAVFGWNIICFVGLLLSLALLFLGISGKAARSLLTWIAARKAPPMGERLYTYYEDHMESLRSETVTHIPYESIRHVLVYHDCFYLILKSEELPSLAHPKSSFTVGTARDFEIFIQEKTGKPVEYIK